MVDMAQNIRRIISRTISIRQVCLGMSLKSMNGPFGAFSSSASTNNLDAPSKALSAGGEPFSYFWTSGLCVICNYVLHTLEYCTSSARRILMFRTFALPSTSKKQSLNLAGQIATAAPTNFLLPFSFLGRFFLFHT